jgi:hypothetical protein
MTSKGTKPHLPKEGGLERGQFPINQNDVAEVQATYIASLVPQEFAFNSLSGPFPKSERVDVFDKSGPEIKLKAVIHLFHFLQFLHNNRLTVSPIGPELFVFYRGDGAVYTQGVPDDDLETVKVGIEADRVRSLTRMILSTSDSEEGGRHSLVFSTIGSTSEYSHPFQWRVKDSIFLEPWVGYYSLALMTLSDIYGLVLPQIEEPTLKATFYESIGINPSGYGSLRLSSKEEENLFESSQTLEEMVPHDFVSPSLFGGKVRKIFLEMAKIPESFLPVMGKPSPFQTELAAHAAQTLVSKREMGKRYLGPFIEPTSLNQGIVYPTIPSFQPTSKTLVAMTESIRKEFVKWIVSYFRKASLEYEGDFSVEAIACIDLVDRAIHHPDGLLGEWANISIFGGKIREVVRGKDVDVKKIMEMPSVLTFLHGICSAAVEYFYGFSYSEDLDDDTIGVFTKSHLETISSSIGLWRVNPVNFLRPADEGLPLEGLGTSAGPFHPSATRDECVRSFLKEYVLRSPSDLSFVYSLTALKAPEGLTLFKNLLRDENPVLYLETSPEFIITQERLLAPILGKKGSSVGGRGFEEFPYYVLRDDLLLGGTKQRVMKHYASRHPEGIVYAGPREGYAQVALGYATFAYGLETIVVISEGRETPQTRLASNLGAGVVKVKGDLQACKERAREIAKERRMYFPSLGFEGDEFSRFFEKEFDSSPLLIYDPSSRGDPHRQDQRVDEVDPDFFTDVWVAGGSGTLALSLHTAFPKAMIHVVQVGKKIDWFFKDSSKKSFFPWVEFHVAPELFGEDARELPPYPSLSTYDAKVWQFARKQIRSGRGNILIWNVAGPVSEDPIMDLLSLFSTPDESILSQRLKRLNRKGPREEPQGPKPTLPKVVSPKAAFVPPKVDSVPPKSLGTLTLRNDANESVRTDPGILSGFFRKAFGLLSNPKYDSLKASYSTLFSKYYAGGPYPVWLTLSDIPERLVYEPDTRLPSLISTTTDRRSGRPVIERIHRGQRKLALHEIQSITRYLKDQPSGWDDVKPTVCIYAGAAPNNKGAFIAHLFVTSEVKFVFIDPAPFNIKPYEGIEIQKIPLISQGKNLTALEIIKRARVAGERGATITTIQDLMTNDIADAIHTVYGKTHNIIFITDIRTNSTESTIKDPYAEENPKTVDILWNLAQTASWLKRMCASKEAASNFNAVTKWRFPFYSPLGIDRDMKALYQDLKEGANGRLYSSDLQTAEELGLDLIKGFKRGKLPFFEGEVLLQAFPSYTSTESRLHISGLSIFNSDIVEYDATEYEEKFFFYNKIGRSFVRHHNPYESPRSKVTSEKAPPTSEKAPTPSSSGCFDSCNDCAIEAAIWEDYIKTVRQYEGPPTKDKVLDLANQLTIATSFGEKADPSKSLCGANHGFLSSDRPMDIALLETIADISLEEAKSRSTKPRH